MNKNIWHYLIGEPFTWISYCFFQPAEFNREFEGGSERFWQRILLMLRLILPMFLICYPIALLIRLILLQFHIIPFLDIISFLLLPTVGIGVGIGLGVISFGISGGFPFGIAGGIAFGIAFGIAGGIAGGITYGIAFGIAFSIAFSIASGIAFGTGLGITYGIAFGITGGIAGGIFGGIAGGIAFGIGGGIGGGIAFNIVDGILGGSDMGIGLGIAFGITGGIAFGITGGIAFGIADKNIIAGIIVSIITSSSYMVSFFRLPLYLASGPSALRAYLASRQNPFQVFTHLHRSSLYWDERVYLPLPYLKRTLLISIEQDEKRGLEVLEFIMAERPQQIWVAQAVALELALRDLSVRKSMKDIAIASERLAVIFPSDGNLLAPQWIETFTRLTAVSQDAAQYDASIGRRAKTQALEKMRANLQRIYPNVAFRDQSLNRRLGEIVAAWLATIEQEQMHLDRMRQQIERIENPYKPGQVLNQRDELFVGRQDVAQRLSELLGQESRCAFLMNSERRMGKSSTLLHLPRLLGSKYIPVFYSLQNPGIYANTFTFLNMIADGIQKQMRVHGIRVSAPEPLGITTRYSSPSPPSSSTSSTPQFYETIPIQSEQTVIGEALKTVRQDNEASAYYIFGRWLDTVERILEQEERVLLLSFDEFEQLADAGKTGRLDLRQLFNWLRDLIQYHPRIALLFSGVSTFREMGVQTGMNWSSWFVNVQTLRVSFLKPDEARKLITKPTPDYPGEDIFAAGVVDKIIEETGCHPFLVQAVCSALIDNLNAERQEQARISDVKQAIEQVFESFDDYFEELWHRTTREQRKCLAALIKLTAAEREATDAESAEDGEPFIKRKSADKASIQQESGMDEKTVRDTLRLLERRDLVLHDEHVQYRIATPMFRKWVERNM